MNKDTKNIPALIILLVQNAVGRIQTPIFGTGLAFLPEWFYRHSYDHQVETHITLENADESLFIMPCRYNLN